MKIYSQNQVELVANALKNHEVIAFPTDTVYGVGVMYGSVEDLNKLKNAKHRPETKPIPMMVSNMEQMKMVAEVDERTQKLCRAFLPGALTLILPSKIDKQFTNGKDTIAIRMPEDDFVLQVIEEVGSPLFVSSANRSGAPTALSMDDALHQLPNIDGIVDGKCKEMWASTIVDCTKEELVILRQGPIRLKELNDATL